eukprot:scaffold21887_cov72-Phaeocystis_antarctica.AAC.1
MSAYCCPSEARPPPPRLAPLVVPPGAVQCGVCWPRPPAGRRRRRHPPPRAARAPAGRAVK